MSTRTLSKSKIDWDSAIEEATRSIKQLETAIDVFKKKKAAGEPWPGSQSTDHSKEQQHSV